MTPRGHQGPSMKSSVLGGGLVEWMFFFLLGTDAGTPRHWDSGLGLWMWVFNPSYRRGPGRGRVETTT